MNWFIILGLAVVIFFNRYFFLEPAISIKIPNFLERMLKYAAPSLLTAICIPIIFF
ncbi:AzlD domain-containing protein, partial [Acinetobacter baumannii]